MAAWRVFQTRSDVIGIAWSPNGRTLAIDHTVVLPSARITGSPEDFFLDALDLPTGELTPAGTATAQLAQTSPTLGWLNGATLTSPCSEDTSTTLWTCQITRPNGYAGLIAWVSTPNGTASVSTSGYTTVRARAIRPAEQHNADVQNSADPPATMDA